MTRTAGATPEPTGGAAVAGAPPRAGGAAAAADEVAQRGVVATVRGGWLGLLGSVVNAVFGFLLVTVVTHGAGARGAGALFTCVAVFTVLSNACKLGADTALVRFVSRDLARTGGAAVPGLLRAALVPTVLAALAVAALTAGTPVLAPRLLPELPQATAHLVVGAFAVLLPVATAGLVLLAVTRGHGRVGPFVGVEQVGKPVLRVVLAVPALALAPGVPALCAAWLAPVALGTAAAWWALPRRGRPAPTPEAGPPAPAAGFWRFAAPRAVSSLFDIGSVWIGVILLSLLTGGADAGVYTAVSRVITAATLLQLAVRLAVAPQVSRLMAERDDAAPGHLHRLSTRWIALFSWPLLMLLAVFPRTVLSVFGPGFGRGAPALVVLCAASLVNVGVGNAQTMLLMAGRSLANLAVAAGAFATQTGLAVWWVPRWGVLGAALSWGAAVVVDNGASAVLVRLRLGLRTVDGGYLRAVLAGLAGAVVAGTVRVVWGDSVVGALLGVPLSIGTFAVAMWRYREALGMGTLLGVLRGGRVPGT